MGNDNSNTHVANATGKPLRIYYHVEKMRLNELVVEGGAEIGGSVSNSGASLDGKVSSKVKSVFKPDSRVRYIRLPANDYCKFSGEGELFVCVFVEDNHNEKSCVDTISINFHVPSDRSFIVTANHNIKYQKYGAGLWIDDLGYDHRPK
ncbi:UNVERIFIED_CONTAM: hypothetical protein FKN15_021153 [Acipenser sinensis]